METSVWENPPIPKGVEMCAVLQSGSALLSAYFPEFSANVQQKNVAKIICLTFSLPIS
jgi:hypothetical protein